MQTSTAATTAAPKWWALDNLTEGISYIPLSPEAPDLWCTHDTGSSRRCYRVCGMYVVHAPDGGMYTRPCLVREDLVRRGADPLKAVFPAWSSAPCWTVRRSAKEDAPVKVPRRAHLDGYWFAVGNPTDRVK